MSIAKVVCDGRCMTGSDLGLPYSGVAYPDPYCSLHGEDWTEPDDPEEEETHPEDTGEPGLVTQVRIILAGITSE